MSRRVPGVLMVEVCMSCPVGVGMMRGGDNGVRGIGAGFRVGAGFRCSVVIILMGVSGSAGAGFDINMGGGARGGGGLVAGVLGFIDGLVDSCDVSRGGGVSTRRPG